MVNIISEILQIDAVAQQKLDDAAHLKEQFELDTRRKLEQFSAQVQQDSQDEISRCRRREDLAAQTERDAIASRKNTAMEKLEQSFAERRQELEQSLYLGALGLAASPERN